MVITRKTYTMQEKQKFYTLNRKIEIMKTINEKYCTFALHGNRNGRIDFEVNMILVFETAGLENG